MLWSLADHVTNLSVHDQGTFDGKREKLASRLTLQVRGRKILCITCSPFADCYRCVASVFLVHRLDCLHLHKTSGCSHTRQAVHIWLFYVDSLLCLRVDRVLSCNDRGIQIMSRMWSSSLVAQQSWQVLLMTPACSFGTLALASLQCSGWGKHMGSQTYMWLTGVL